MMATNEETKSAKPRTHDDEADVSDNGSNGERDGKRSELKGKGELVHDGGKDGNGSGGSADKGPLASLNALGAGGRRNKKIQIDREKTCPFLVRVFCKIGGYRHVEEYSTGKLPTADEVQIHTWKDATLRELTSLLSQTHPEAASASSRISFRAAYQDVTRGGVYHLRDLGTVTNHRRSLEEDKTLDEARFVIGDYIDVAIIDEPKSHGGFNNSREEEGGGRFGPLRGNGPPAGARHHPYGRPTSGRSGGSTEGNGGGFGIRGRSGSNDFGRRVRKHSEFEGMDQLQTSGQALVISASRIGVPSDGIARALHQYPRPPPASAVIAEARASLRRPSRPFTPAVSRDGELFIHKDSSGGAGGGKLFAAEKW
ncbi:Histone deacetylase complex subunit sap18 [Dinochytrium kinnereticum]|nr:Histone deacetylase complex subunit sap18 [Dinochytrium kinnereticum]